MHSGCNLVCCPACGYQTVDPQRSKLVRLVRYFLALKTSAKHASSGKDETTLAEVSPGSKAEVIGFSEEFPPDQRAYLQAYGLVPNHWVQVVQHSPVTIVRLDNLELALESDIARGIQVQKISKIEAETEK